MTHSVGLWTAEQAVFLLTRFAVGRDGKKAHERLRGKMEKRTRLVIRGRNLVEEETSRRSAWKVDVHVEGWRVLRHQGNFGRSHRGETKRRSAHMNGPEEDSEGWMGPKQSVDDHDVSMAQGRRRRQDGWRASNKEKS